MEYFLRQIGGGNTNPVIIELNKNDIMIGKDTYPVLNKYPQVLPNHACFMKKNDRWYVKCLQGSGKIFVNGTALVVNCLQEIQIGDHIGFGVEGILHNGFVCSLSAKLKEAEVIDLSDDDAPIVKSEPVNNCDTLLEKSGEAIGALHAVSNSRNSYDMHALQVKKEVTGKKIKNEVPQFISLSSNNSSSLFNSFSGASTSTSTNISDIKNINMNLRDDFESASNDVNSNVTVEVGLPPSSHEKKSNLNSRPIKLGIPKTDLTYSETENIITISDNETYLDFNSSRTVKQEFFYDDFDDNYDGNSDKINTLFSKNNSTLCNISESIEDHVVRAERMYGNGKCSANEVLAKHKLLIQSNPNSPGSVISNPRTTILTPKDSNKNESLDQFQHTSESLNGYSSDSSVSSHDDIIIPFSKRKIGDSANDENKKLKSCDDTKSKESKNEKPKLVISSTKPEAFGRILFTEPKQNILRPKKSRGREEWFEEKYTLPSLPHQEALPGPSTVKHSSKKSAKLLIIKSSKLKKSLVSSKRKHLQKSKSGSNGNVLINPLKKNGALASYKIPKVSKKLSADKKSKLASLASNSNMVPTEAADLDPKLASSKKTPSITRKPDKYASRSAFLMSEITAPKGRKKSASKKEKDSSQQDTGSSGGTEMTNIPLSSVEEVNWESISKINFSIINQNDKSDERASSISTVPVVINATRKAKKPQVRDHDPSNLLVINPQNSSLPITESASELDFRLKHASPPINKQASKIHTDGQIVDVAQPFNNVNCKTFPRNHFNQDRDEPSVSGYQAVTDEVGSCILGKENKQLESSNLVRAFSYHPDDIFQIPVKLFNKTVQTVLKSIVEWKEKWLEEQQWMDTPPPCLLERAKLLPLHFESLHNYISSFIPMLLLEVWEKLHQASKQMYVDEKRIFNKFYFIICEEESKWDMTEYHCEVLVNSISFAPKAGNMVILEIIDDKMNAYNPILGYVTFHEVQCTSIQNITSDLKNVPMEWKWNARLMKFKVLVRNRSAMLSPKINKIMKGNGICSISKELNLVGAFQNLESSPLCQCILKPNVSYCFENYPSVSSPSNFNDRQAMVVEGISTEVQKQTPNPQFFLLQGPPGTGKTHVIIGLLEKMIFSYPKLKILVVTPSSVAVDEIGCRLMDLKERSSWRYQSIKFVRIGLKHQISQKMEPFSLDTLYEKDEINKEKEKLEQMNFEIQENLKQNDPLAQQKVKVFLEAFRKHKEKVEFLSSDEEHRKDYMCKLLAETQIVLTTLRFCSWPLLLEACKPSSDSSFSCCIVDESTQCTEIEILQVMALGINKVILMGDPQQLPAVVHSKVAKTHGYERSMFERFHRYFLKTRRKSPVFTLSDQYRMHSEICSFPAKEFYNNELRTAPNVDSRYENFPIPSYSVIHIQNGEDPVSSHNSCADSIINICIQLMTLSPTVSVGIIVPNEELLSIYRSWINILKKNPNYERIEVNTVEKFQGQEKDVIILSCNYVDESNSFLTCRKRLNVAITRARQCLILCMFSTNWTRDSVWRNLVSDAESRKLCRNFQQYRDVCLISW